MKIQIFATKFFLGIHNTFTLYFFVWESFIKLKKFFSSSKFYISIKGDYLCNYWIALKKLNESIQRKLKCLNYLLIYLLGIISFESYTFIRLQSCKIVGNLVTMFLQFLPPPRLGYTGFVNYILIKTMKRIKFLIWFLKYGKIKASGTFERYKLKNVISYK